MVDCLGGLFDGGQLWGDYFCQFGVIEVDYCDIFWYLQFGLGDSLQCFGGEGV